jgi:RimJ/RimL family protein N-acetyltransferase
MREPDFNISHKRLPEWDEHISFIESDPYQWWDIITSDAYYPCGVAYVTRNNEVGIWIAPKYRRQGLAAEVLEQYKRRMYQVYQREKKEPPYLLANINPKNQPSQAFFRKHNFRLITQASGTDGMMTFRWDAYTDQHGPNNEPSD